ncbi:MAG: hypothetical protein HC803_05110 [Saprospiraceae bacterium]|nr:hypothetical protein [Saprospiraceae bacterium]
MPTFVNYELPISQYVNNFEYEDFDHTVESYFEILAISRLSTDENLLHKALFNYELLDLATFITSVNQRYILDIQLEEETEEAFVRRFLDILRRNRIDVYAFVLDEFIRTEKGSHVINEAEKRNMERFFTIYDFDKLKYVINPQINMTLKTKYVGIEINAKIIRQWDGINNKPMKGNLPPIILGSVENVTFSTEDGLETDLQKVCFSRSEITETGILIKPFSDEVDLVTTANDYRYFENESDELGEFSGLLIKRANFTIPFNDHIISGIGNNILLNNNIILGEIDIQIISSDETNIVIQTSNGEQKIATKEFEKFFKSKGFDKFEIHNFDSFIQIRFEKKG